MIGLMVFAALGAALWGLIKAIKFSARAFSEAENRRENVLRAAGGLLLAGLLTYPLILGPVVARVACASGVGLEITARSDLRNDGYLVNWPRDPGASFMAQAVEDLLLGRIAFFETSSFSRDGNLQHISLAPADSRDCVNPGFLLGERTLPPGMCLEVRGVQSRESNYDIETSRGYWLPHAFQKRISLVDRVNDRIVASYTIRRIPMARFDFDGQSTVNCPRDPSGHQTGYALTAKALVAKESIAARSDAAAPKEELRPCKLPPLPENVEVHLYSSYRGIRSVAIQIDRSGSETMENDVYVNRPAVPVVLYLTSFDPVVWRIRQTPDSQIVAVIADSSSAATAVTGVKASVPLLISSEKYGRMSNCRRYEASELVRALNLPFTSRVTGNEDPHITLPFVIGPKLDEGDYVEYPDIAESQYAFTKGMPAGAAGVDYLVSSGAARLLTREDRLALMQQKLPRVTAPGREAIPVGLSEGNSVILLRATPLPDGMFGSQMRLFIIPRDVPQPSPPFGHNEFLKVDADCSRSPCRY